MKFKVILPLVAVAVACGCKSSVRPATIFPETNEVSGWSRVRENRVFEAHDLWQYIDGDADRYVQAGVQRTLTADYRYRNGADAVVDIYIMSSPEGARKVLDAEPSMGSQPLAFGQQGRLYDASLVFRRDRYLVRLVAYEEAPEVQKALVELGRAIEEKAAKLN